MAFNCGIIGSWIDRGLLQVTLVVLVSLLRIPCANSAIISDFVDFSLYDASGSALFLPGRMYVPPESSSGPRPLILFLHGGGNVGSDNTSHITSGTFDNLLAEAKRRGAFLYAPQTALNWANRAITDNVMTMIGRSLAQYPVENSRVYITGLSLGGGGTWNMLSRYGGTFAAGVPICGVRPVAAFSARNLIDDSVWAFHARNDLTVDVSVTQSSINGILLGAEQPALTFPPSNDPFDYHFESAHIDLRYTEFATGGHAIWNRVYDTPALYDWMFSRSLAIPEPSSLLLILLSCLVAGIFQRE